MCQTITKSDEPNAPIIRKLNISFNLDRSVEYHFSRNVRPLSQYIIEHPADQVQLLKADPGYRATVEANGWLRLSWEDNPMHGWSTVHYRKLDKLLPAFEGQGCEQFIFSEDTRIQARNRFGLWLGSRSGPLSAVGKLSNASFSPSDGRPLAFRPRELEEHIFQTSGMLNVRWVLEPSTC